MPAASLREMALTLCKQNIRDITDIGSLPFDLIRPALVKVERPDQLHQLEQNSPHIVGLTGDMWLQMIKRDIPNWDQKPHQPRDPKLWYKVYRKLKADAQAEMAAGEDRLKAALININASREQNQAQVVSNKTIPKPTVRKRQAITYGYVSGRAGSKGAYKMSALDRIRRESSNAKATKLNKPTHELNKKASGVKMAPATMLEDLRRQQQFRSPRPLSAVSAGSKGVGNSSPALNSPGYKITEDREARLRALKAGKTSSAPRPELSVDFLESDELDGADGKDDDHDNDDNIFGDLPKKTANQSTMVLSPQSKMLKRRAEPQLFRTAKKRNMDVR